jgi:hypothetical protein
VISYALLILLANLHRTAKIFDPYGKTTFATSALPLHFYFIKEDDMKEMMFSVTSAIALSGTAQVQSKGKTLIACFSWSGNTREMAKQIRQTGTTNNKQQTVKRKIQ